MASLADYIAAVDRFMTAEKMLVGVDQPNWAPGRDETTETLKLPVEVEGELVPDAKFYIDVDPHAEQLSFAMGLVYGYCVCRLDYGNEASHLNVIGQGKGKFESVIIGPHFHAWDDNKQFVDSIARGFKLERATRFSADARNFDSILRWFCGTNRIILPHTHRITLPPKGGLL